MLLITLAHVNLLFFSHSVHKNISRSSYSFLHTQPHFIIWTSLKICIKPHSSLYLTQMQLSWLLLCVHKWEMIQIQHIIIIMDCINVLQWALFHLAQVCDKMNRANTPSISLNFSDQGTYTWICSTGTNSRKSFEICGIFGGNFKFQISKFQFGAQVCQFTTREGC